MPELFTDQPLASLAGEAAWSPPPAPTGHFNLYDRTQLRSKLPSFSRRDYYKISLLTGVTQLAYADQHILVDRPALVFSNPLIPYACEAVSPEQGGYLCLFTEAFLLGDTHAASLQQSPLFRLGANPVLFLNETQHADLSYLFQRMLRELKLGYLHKQDVLRAYVQIILHEALKMQPQATSFQQPPGASRLVALFLDLLERQFPVDAPDQALQLRSASDFAAHLSVHVNHLNRAVRQLTGKTTTVHLTERLATEAKALFEHTNWSTAEIAYRLGFGHPTNFNNFFKKHTGHTPSTFRAALARGFMPGPAPPYL